MSLVAIATASVPPEHAFGPTSSALGPAVSALGPAGSALGPAASALGWMRAHEPASWLDRTLQRVTTPDDAVLFALLVLALGFAALGWLVGRTPQPVATARAPSEGSGGSPQTSPNASPHGAQPR